MHYNQGFGEMLQCLLKGNGVPMILGIETSCDDTSAAIVRTDGYVIGNLLINQDEVHRPFGGIVPEIASRNHTFYLLNLIERLLEESRLGWKDIGGIAVTNRPGLLGSLLVGVITAKTLSLAKNKPFVGVHHLEGHIMAPFLSDEKHKAPLFFKDPFLALVVSGGHTALYRVNKFGNYNVLGETIDDAAGEAFDKFAKMLNLGYPGGAVIDRKAQSGNISRYNFPRGLGKEDNLNFSFSGLKTSALLQLEKMSDDEKSKNISDLCASYQEAIVDSLMIKVRKALKLYSLNKVIVTGGVSANSRLRFCIEKLAEESIEVVIPPLKFCTDNAAMIAYAGLKRMEANEFSDLSLTVSARSELGHV